MQTSIQSAKEKGYTLKYLAPGMDSTDIAQIFGLAGGGGSGGEGNVLSLAEIERRNALKGQLQHINTLISILERFNGVQYVTVGDTAITTGAGTKISEQTNVSNTATGERNRYVFVPISAEQIAFLEQSHTQLKQSVYDGLVLEGRIKHYLDGIQLSITKQGVSMGSNRMKVANDLEWRDAA